MSRNLSGLHILHGRLQWLFWILLRLLSRVFRLLFRRLPRLRLRLFRLLRLWRFLSHRLRLGL